jgi:hypothetical protein
VGSRVAKDWSDALGWPIVEPGLLMAGVGRVMFVYTDNRITEAGFARHLLELARAIDQRDPDARVGVVYDTADGVEADARRRQRLGDLLRPRHEKLARTTAGFALVTHSPVLRGALRAIFWLAPPPYDWTIASNVREGLLFIQRRLPDLDVEDALRDYERLKMQHLRPKE